jgi:hypothetical protein
MAQAAAASRLAAIGREQGGPALRLIFNDRCVIAVSVVVTKE